MGNIPIFMYHALETASQPAGSVDAGEQRYVLQAEQFCEQLLFLSRNGFTTTSLSALSLAVIWPKKAVVLTFDDGHVSNFTLSLPLLLKFGYIAEFFVTTNWIGTHRYLKREEVKALHDAGMGIGSHGSSHAFLNNLDDKSLERELRNSREVLMQITGSDIVSLSAPGGRCCPRVAAVAKKFGYRFLYASRPGLLYPDDSSLFLPRLAIRSNTDLDLYTKMADGDHGCINKLGRNYNISHFAVKFFGEKLYQTIRRLMLRN